MKTITWLNGKVRLIDQSRLPLDETYLELDDYRQLCDAIREMRIRGAPALGIAAAYAVALGAQKIDVPTKPAFLAQLDEVCAEVAATRPTARNLFWGIEQMKGVAIAGEEPSAIRSALLAKAQAMEAEDVETNQRLGRLGAELINDGANILTHCNAGALATVAYGTALGVIRAAHEQGKRLHVFADETRPLLQGARLTAWELKKEGIPVTLIADAAAGHLMHCGEVDCVIVGADRIAANGDVANKIGTYQLAVLAMENGVPFYVAAPVSTIDLSLSSGADILIEERRPEEITLIGGTRIAPEGIGVRNPAFDVTPHYYVTTIITDRGVVREPYEARLRQVVEEPSSVVGKRSSGG